MKFTEKLFFVMMAALTAIFTVFGMWMLNVYFQRALDRELERGSTEVQFYVYLFEMAYQASLEYGDEYAMERAVNVVEENLGRSETQILLFRHDGELLAQESFLLGGELYRSTPGLAEELLGMSGKLTPEQSIAEGIRNLSGDHALINLCLFAPGDGQIVMGLCKSLDSLYQDRNALLAQYRLMLVILLLAGGASIYLLSRYMTLPIRRLGRVAGRIANGDLESRARIPGKDEIHDLGESFNRMADRLVEQMKEKELEARQKEDFTAAFAHELKTPLTSIIGYADMLNSVECTEEEQREASFYIYNQGKRLESLSHKLLELVSMEKHPLSVRPIAAKSIEEILRVTMRPIFQERGIRGKIELERGTLYGDQDLLLSLFYNLLDNAVKAVGSDGFILCKGRVLLDGYEIKVVDNGRGIPESEISRITEPFYMVDKSRSRKEGGAGIGMALCKRILALHGGTLEVMSKLGEGTVMLLKFPDRQIPDKEGGTEDGE